MVVAVLSLAGLAILAVVMLVFVAIAVFVAPLRDPRKPGSHRTLTLDELRDDEDG